MHLSKVTYVEGILLYIFLFFCIICIQHHFAVHDTFRTDLQAVCGSRLTGWGSLVIQTIWIWIWWTPIPPRAWLVALGRLPYVWLNMAWDSGVETSIQLFLFTSFLSFSLPFPPIPQSPPPLAAGWPLLVFQRRPQHVRSWGGAGGLWWTEKSSCADGPLSPPPHPSHWAKASCRFPLPGSRKLLQQPLAVTRAAFQLPELWVVQEKLCCFMLLLDEISAISASTPLTCSCRLLCKYL